MRLWMLRLWVQLVDMGATDGRSRWDSNGPLQMGAALVQEADWDSRDGTEQFRLST